MHWEKRIEEAYKWKSAKYQGLLDASQGLINSGRVTWARVDDREHSMNPGNITDDASQCSHHTHRYMSPYFIHLMLFIHFIFLLHDNSERNSINFTHYIFDSY